MDIKKQINQLDPKLQVAYDRVMGTAIPKQPIAVMPAKPAATINKPSVSIFESLKTQGNSKTFQPITKSSIPQPVKQPIKQPTSIPQTQTQPDKKKNKLKPLLIIFGGIIFLLIYTLAWIKIFGLKLPFLTF